MVVDTSLYVLKLLLCIISVCALFLDAIHCVFLQCAALVALLAADVSVLFFASPC